MMQVEDIRMRQHALSILEHAQTDILRAHINGKERHHPYVRVFDCSEERTCELAKAVLMNDAEDDSGSRCADTLSGAVKHGRSTHTVPRIIATGDRELAQRVAGENKLPELRREHDMCPVIVLTRESFGLFYHGKEPTTEGRN